MDTLLSGGDHAIDGRGIPVTVADEHEIIQQSLIRLSVKKGAFGLDPELGSELFKLSRYNGETRNRVALSYVREALAPVSGIRVESVSCEIPEAGVLKLKIDAVIGGKPYLLEVNTN